MQSIILDIAQAAGVLATGIVYGTDAFFSIVGAAALRRSSAGGLTDVMGRMHEIADRRMVVVGATGLIMSIGCAIGGETPRGKMLGVAASLVQVVYIALYSRYSKPINEELVAGARAGVAVAHAHELQRRWDRVVYVRYALMSVAMVCLVFVDR